MVSAVAPKPARSAEPGILNRLAPAEGWITILLHLTLVLVAARAIERESWADGLSVLTPVAGLAMVCGLVFAKSRVPDLASHALSFMLGLAMSVALTAGMLDQAGGWRDRLAFLRDRAELWFQRVEAGRRVDDADLFVLMMTFTVWLIAYSSAWMLYRRRWPLAALALPGVIILINLGYAPASSTLPLLIYTIGALVLAARHYAFRRQVEWSYARLPSPERLPWHFLRAGLTVALMAVFVGWSLPPDTAQPLIDRMAERLDRPLDSLEDRWNDLMSPLAGESPKGGSFATFGDSFRLGGELNLSDDPVALAQAARPIYLAVHRYNWYDGHGWSTDIEDTFRARGDEGEVRAPLITFRPGDSVFLSPEMTGDRTRETARITVYRPKGDLLMTVDAYLASSERASVQVSWRQLQDEPFDVHGTDLFDQPEDLRELLSLLRQARFDLNTAAGSAQMTDLDLERRITAMQASLSQRFLNTEWQVGDDLRVSTLLVTGQLPVYDDVEAVRADQPPARDEDYLVTGLASFAAPGDLRASGSDDPAFVTARYQQLPATVSAETVALTREIVAGADNRYDQAMAIQRYLRETFAYEEKITVPPEDRDVVDYFLFESKQGYCEYFASAMVVMLRSADVPARIAAGYRAVEYDDQAGGYLYREKQAHTWVEVYFPGYGWIPFEPTPVADEIEHGDPEEAPDPPPLTTPEAEPTPTLQPTVAAAATATPPPSGAAPDPVEPDGGVGAALRGDIGRIVIAVLGTMFLIVAVASAVWLWGFRGLSPVGALFARVQRVGRWWGIRPDPALTPVEYAQELGQVAPPMRTPARMLAQLYETERYGSRPVAERDAAAGKSAWKDLRAALLRSWRGRRRSASGRARER